MPKSSTDLTGMNGIKDRVELVWYSMFGWKQV